MHTKTLITILLLTSIASAADCPTGYQWDRMSGVGCVQIDCNSIPHAHYGYTKNCVCGSDDCGNDPYCIECFGTVNGATKLVACVKQGEQCPNEKTTTTTTTLSTQMAAGGLTLPGTASGSITTTTLSLTECDKVCKRIYSSAIAVPPKAGRGMFIVSGCACTCPEGYVWSYLGENGRPLDPTNCPMMRPGEQYTAEQLRNMGCGEPSFECKRATGAVAAEIALWNQTQQQCNHQQNPTLSVEGFLQYLRKVEEANPGKTRKQIIAKLHAMSYPEDIHRTVGLDIVGDWGIKADLFKDGAETAGYETVDPLCVKAPKFVTLASGERVDIAHSYAGIRSDLNREDHWASQATAGGWTWVVRHANTNWGDYFQVLTSFNWTTMDVNWDFASDDQMKGDDVGLWLAGYYQDNSHANTPLSEAYSEYFTQAGN